MADSVYTDKTPPGPRAKGDHSHIIGWGADLDDANRPAYPKERTPPRLPTPHSHDIPAQKQHVEVLHSNERPGMTPLFGSPVPPSGMSGSLRRAAFRFSENDIRHWLILLLADRINMGEGLVSDLAQGHVPNIFAEMGGPAEFRHNRAGAMKKVAVAGAALALAVYLARRRRNRLR